MLALLVGTSPLAAQESGIQAAVHGLILMNAFHTTDNVNNSDLPQFATPASPANPRAGATGATVRQSRVMVDAAVPDFAGGGLRGELDVDFFGGQQPSTGGRTFPLLRIRRAFAEITWRRFALLVGQEAPPIAPVSPSSLATIGLPGFAGAGNLWLWLPQIRLSANLLPTGDGAASVGLEVTALAPTSGEAQGTFLTQPDIAERSGRPYLQSRIKARWGVGQDQGEVSFGGHYGWLVGGNGELVPSRALAASVLAPLFPGLELRGEAFTGQALAGLGGGGIGQNLGPSGTPVSTKGGWAQLNVRPSSAWELGGGAGIDDPDDGDLDPAGRLRNIIFDGHITWRRAPAVVGVEVRRLRTRYRAPVDTRSATHVNLGVGFEF